MMLLLMSFVNSGDNYMCNIRSYCGGRILANETAMSNPVVLNVVKDMEARNFEPLPRPNEGTWYISDRH